MVYIESLCLFVKDYLSTEQFVDLFFDNIYEYEKILDKDIYFKVIDTNFNSSHEIVTLKNHLDFYLNTKYNREISSISDSYVELIIASNRKDAVANILKNNYKRKDVVCINCSLVDSQYKFISIIKDSLQFPNFCGHNWDAINDLIYDVLMPQKLILEYWNRIELLFPDDAKILKQILSKVNKDECDIMYM